MAIRTEGCLLILFLAGATFVALPRAAAQSSSPNSEQALRSFRFVATGAKGEPITDLRLEEIQVTDNGKRQPLAFSRLLRTTQGAVTLGPREVSNRGYDQFFSSTLLLLDLLNANITERGSAWNETIQSLGSLESAENVYLFLMTPDANLYPVHAWSPDPSDPPATPWTSRIRPLLNQALGVVEKIKPVDLTAAPGLTADPTYKALRTLGRQYAALPGQKRVIWVTNGIPLTVVGPNGTVYMDFRPELKQTGEEFSRLGISLYTVHQQDRSAEGINTQETLQSLPPLTGGRWFENDALGQAVTQARNDARATYQAGYSATAKDEDGKFHKLRVTTTRKNVRILAAEGYTADPPDAVAKNTLDLVASRPFDTPDIGLRVSFADAGANTRVLIRVDPRDLALQHAGNSYAGAFSSVVLYFNAEGQVSTSAPIVTKVSLNQEQLDAAIKNGYLVTADEAIPSGSRRARLLVQDDASGTAGSLSFPLPSP